MPRSTKAASRATYPSAKALPISVVERETGLTKDALRKWEARYGFPRPQRDARGERCYPVGQVERLRLIKRMLDTGLRPSRIVPLSPQKLSRLAQIENGEWTSAAPGSAADDEDLLRALPKLGPSEIPRRLNRLLAQEGLQSFLRDRLPRLTQSVGDAWSRGDLDIYQEHLFSQGVQGLLRRCTDELNEAHGRPRILLTTPSGERHTLGLLMAAAYAALKGAHCLYLDAETPGNNICSAVEDRAIDVVGLSISLAYPARRVMPMLAHLQASLPRHVDIWVGGGGALRSVKPEKRIRLVPRIGDVDEIIKHWRQGH